MIKRPKPGEDEEDLLRMQEEFLREKAQSNIKPAAQVTNLRHSETTKRPATNESDGRKPSKYAQLKGLKEKKARTESATGSVMGDILEKNIQETDEEKQPEFEDDKVYFPKVIPSLLGDIVEKYTDSFIDLSTPMPAEGFPVVTKRNMDVNKKLGGKRVTFNEEFTVTNIQTPMDVDLPSNSHSTKENTNISLHLPEKSFIVSSQEADEIHKENVKVLSKMSEKEILEERNKLLSTLDPKLVEFIKRKRMQATKENTTVSQYSEDKGNNIKDNSIQSIEKMDTNDETNEMTFDNDSLWDNDVLSHPDINKWLNFESLEKDKLEWMRGIEESKKIKADEPYEARFDFKGYLLPYTMEYTEKTKTLYHHGEESHRPGYSLSELFELSRSTVTQQRVMALNTIAGILEYNSAGTYKDVIEIPLSKIFFIIRIAVDENKVIILEPALKALRNLIYNRIDEASLDALLGFEEGTQQPCLENDKSEIQELESQESELKDFHLAEIDIISAVLRTDIIQRLYYILEAVKPSFNCVQYTLQIITRLARDSAETAKKIVEANHLMNTVVRNFVPCTGINFQFHPQIVYNGKPILAALKLIRVLSLQSKEIGEILISKYEVLKPVSEYISSGVDGTYGLRIQIEAFCILSNLLHYGLGIDNAMSLCPIVTTTLYKHVQGTEVYFSSSIISATHAAVVLQFVHKFLLCRVENLVAFKHQVYPLLKEGIQKWLVQISRSENYTCGHLRLVCAALDCCKTILLTEGIKMQFLEDSLKSLAQSKGYKELIKNLIPSSNLLSNVETKDLNLTKNLMSLGGSVIDSIQKVLPLLNIMSPLPFLASLFNLLVVLKNPEITEMYLSTVADYHQTLASKTPKLCDNWFTRIETDFVFANVQLAIQVELPEAKKDLLYTVANKLCYILRIDKKKELEYLFNQIVFNKKWFTTERLMNLINLSDADGFSKALTSIEDIKLCYNRVVNLNYKDTGPNVVLKKWQEPILPRDWIYLPILTLYSKSQETESGPKIFGDHAKKVESLIAAEKELIIRSSLEWILFNELCFPDLLKDIDATDRFCRIMCVFLCDNSLFLVENIKNLLQKCTQILFKRKNSFNFDNELVGLHNFQDFYTQFLEQFQSVSYGDFTFAACVLVPLAQRHNVKWRKLVWSEYAGCLRALDCPEELLCYELKEYLYPEETDESLIKSYFQALLSSNLLRPNTIAHKIASHHVKSYKNRSNV